MINENANRRSDNGDQVLSRIIPQPGTLPSVQHDALEAFKVLKSGGVVILPTDVGYGICSSSAEGIERAFHAKKRKPGHTLGIVGSFAQHSQLHILDDEPSGIVSPSR